MKVRVCVLKFNKTDTIGNVITIVMIRLLQSLPIDMSIAQYLVDKNSAIVNLEPFFHFAWQMEKAC